MILPIIIQFQNLYPYMDEGNGQSKKLSLFFFFR